MSRTRTPGLDDPVVADFLRQLRAALQDVPRAGREEVLRDVQQHLAEARSEEPAVTALEHLGRLGPVEEIAAAARERYGVSAGRAGGLEITAVVLLLAGGLVVPVLGWLVGVVLLWSSRRWSVGDKLLGTLVLPGGLSFPFLALPAVAVLGLDVGALGSTELLLLLPLLLAVEVVVAVRLLRRARTAP